MSDENLTGPAHLNRAREALAAGRLVRSLIVRSSRGAEIASLALAAGFDALYVDLEHSPLSLDDTSRICLTAQALGVTPLVRVPESRLDLIGVVLDNGAMGVIVPHLATEADAVAAVAAARYPPEGVRSAGGLAVQLGYRPIPAAEANALLNDATLVVGMIESRLGMENVEAIASVPGVDILMIGANDLLADYGMTGDLDNPFLLKAFRRVLAVCQPRNVCLGVGGLSSRPSLMRAAIDMGARYVSVGSDTSFLLAGARKAVLDLEGTK
jgi:2-keto-3-deoxy-L-rhamnonate aldolase RhmA